MSDMSGGGSQSGDQNITVTLDANDRGLTNGFNSAITTVGNFGKVFGFVAAPIAGVGREIDSVSTKIGHLATGTGAGLTAAFGLMARAASGFETDMAHVNTITNLTGAQLAQVSQGVLSLTATIPQSAHDMSSALYMIASAGFNAADSQSILKQAGIAATAGMADETAAAEAILQVLDAYGMSASQAASVNDTLFQTVKLGITDFATLTQSMSNYIGTAAAAKVNINDVNAAFATMSVNGLQAAGAGTAVNRVLEAFLKPSTDMKKITESLGYTSAATMLQTLGLHDSMVKLVSVAGNSAAGLQPLFLNIHSLQGALALVNGDFSNYNRIFGQMVDPAQRAGAAQAAFNIQVNTFSAQSKLLKNDVNALGVEIGAHLLPVLTAGSKAAQTFVGFLLQMPGPLKETIAIVGGLGGIVLSIGGFFLATAVKAAVLKLGIAGLNAVMGPEGMVPILAKDAIAESTLTGTIIANTAAVTANVPVVGTLLGALQKMQVIIPYIGAAFMGMMIGFTAGEAIMNHTRQAAQSFVDTLTKGMDPQNFKSVSDSINTLQNKYMELESKQGTALGQMAQNIDPWSSKSNRTHIQELRDIQKEIDALNAWRNTAQTNGTAIAAATGWTGEAIQKLATSLGVDLGGAADKVVQRLIDAARAGGQDVDAFNAAVASTDAYTAALKDLTNVTDSYTKASNILTNAQTYYNSTATSQVSLEAQDARNKATLATSIVNLTKDTDALNKLKAGGIQLTIQQAQLDQQAASLASEKAKQKLALDLNTLAGVRAAGQSGADLASASLAVQQDQLDLANAQNDLTDKNTALGEANSGKTYNDAVAAAAAKVQSDQASIAESNAKIQADAQKTADAMAGTTAKIDVSLTQFDQYLKNADAAQQNWFSNLLIIIQRGAPQQVVDQFVQMGQNAAPILAQFATSTNATFSQISADMLANATSGGDDYNHQMTVELDALKLILTGHAKDGVQGFINEIDKMSPGINATAPQVQTAAADLAAKVKSGLLPANQGVQDLMNNFANLPAAAKSAADQTGSYLSNFFKDGKLVIPQISQDQLNAIIAYEAGQSGGTIVGGGPAQGGPPSASIPSGHAAGAIYRGPQVSSTPILWGEAGREAYIPLTGTYRSQAVSLTQQVAHEFGYSLVRMAAGGIFGTDRSATVGSVSGGSGYVIIQIPVPEQLVTEMNFGDIRGVDMKDAVAYAKRQQRTSNLRNPGRTVVPV